MLKNYIIKNNIKRLPTGMELSNRVYYISSPVGLESKVIKTFSDSAERFAVLRVVSYVRICQHMFQDKKNMFVNIHCELLTDISGKNYRKYIDWLVKNKIIEVNESYSNREDFTKSYRYTDKAYNKPLNVSKWIVKDLVDTDSKYKTDISSMIFTPDGKYDKELLYCIQHENQLSIPNSEDIIDSLPDEDKSYASEWFNKINSGQCIPSPQDKSTRFYLNSIMMDGEYRKYLIYNKNQDILNYDIKSAYPSFIKYICLFNSYSSSSYHTSYVIPILIGDFSKNSILQSFYNDGDFYDILRKPYDNMSRKQAKTMFQVYINNNNTIKKKEHIFTKRLEEMGHKDMADYIIQANNIWSILEQLETDLMCSICNRCIEQQIVYIRQHDGFLTLLEDKDKVDAIINEPAHNLFRYKSEIL